MGWRCLCGKCLWHWGLLVGNTTQQQETQSRRLRTRPQTHGVCILHHQDEYYFIDLLTALLDSVCPTSRSIEELSKRSLDHFPSPDLLFPMPALEFDFRIAVTLNPELSRSENRVHKEIITVTSGKWSGTFGNGRVLVCSFPSSPLPLCHAATNNTRAGWWL